MHHSKTNQDLLGRNRFSDQQRTYLSQLMNPLKTDKTPTLFHWLLPFAVLLAGVGMALLHLKLQASHVWWAGALFFWVLGSSALYLNLAMIAPPFFKPIFHNTLLNIFLLLANLGALGYVIYDAIRLALPF